MCRERYCTHRWVDTNTATLTYAGRQRQLDRTWADWVVVSNSTTTSAQTWIDWNTASTTNITVQGTLTYSTVTNGLVPAPITAEQAEAAVEERRAQTERRRKREAEIAAARERAEALLLSCLDEEQRAELQVHDRFHVTTPSGRRYCIHRGRAGNVTSRDPHGRLVKYCIHDAVGLPDADTMLAQKLLLETDETGFLQTANASSY